MGQFVEEFSKMSHYMPWVSFIAGLGGGLHCVGMCGGLVTASCASGRDVVLYQLGRLIGYLSLGLVAGLAGELLKNLVSTPWPALIGALLLGGLFIFWGVENWRGRKAELPMPRFLSRWYGHLWRLAKGRSGMVGVISIFLPCGLLYGVVLGSVAIQDPLTAGLSMGAFWLGTIPSMVLAPQLVRKVLRPLRQKLPRVYGVALVLVGLATIGHRLGSLSLGSAHAHGDHRPQLEAPAQIHHCH